MESKKCDVLVVDTAGFIKSARLEEIGEQVREGFQFTQPLKRFTMDLNV